MVVNTNKKQLGGIIDYIYPLLDPDLTQEERIEKHKTWYNTCVTHDHNSTTFITDLFVDLDAAQDAAHNACRLAAAAPQILNFLPSNTVMAKLQRRASQITDILMELNNKERKRLNIEKEHDPEEPVDPTLQSLRILPPDFKYPTFENNYPNVFKELYLDHKTHLVEKYKPQDATEREELERRIAALSDR